MAEDTGSPAALPDLSIVVPVFNEESAVPAFIGRIRPLLDGIGRNWEMIFVNDGSTDRTLSVLDDANRGDGRIKVLNFSRNYGKEIALTAGLDHSSGNAVIPIDVDLQDPPELIAEMVRKWHDGFDVVLASRSNRSGDSWPKRVTAAMFYKVMNWLSDVPLPYNVGDFRLMDRQVVNALCRYRERKRFMKGLFASLGFRQTTIHYTRQRRSAGKTKFNPVQLWGLALEGIVSFSTKPLKIWTYIGVLCTLLSFMYIIVIVVRVFLYGTDVSGYASLMSVVLFLNGITITGLGIIGEYVARIFNEIKRRPLYIIRSSIGTFRNTEIDMSQEDRLSVN